jgi:Tol biopolymer transport system component
MVLDGLGRHGAQYTWSADGQEIAYVEGDYHEGMSARVLNWQTHQSRTLVESQSPTSLTGASYSPDGKWIAVREQSLESSEDATLWLIDVKTEAKIRLT